MDWFVCLVSTWSGSHRNMMASWDWDNDVTLQAYFFYILTWHWAPTFLLLWLGCFMTFETRDLDVSQLWAYFLLYPYRALGFHIFATFAGMFQDIYDHHLLGSFGRTSWSWLIDLRCGRLCGICTILMPTSHYNLFARKTVGSFSISSTDSNIDNISSALLSYSQFSSIILYSQCWFCILCSVMFRKPDVVTWKWIIAKLVFLIFGQTSLSLAFKHLHKVLTYVNFPTGYIYEILTSKEKDECTS